MRLHWGDCIVVHPQFFDDIKNLNFAPTQLNEKTWHRGLTPMAFADRSVAKVDAANLEKETFDKYGNFIQLSCTDASTLDSKPPQAPRTTEKLCLYLRRWMVFLKAIWGSTCPLYVQSKALYNKLLVLLDRVIRSADFMKRRGASIMWELCYETRRFFQQLVTSDDFAEATENNSAHPMAQCTINVHCILTLDGGPAGDLPKSLRPITPKEKHRPQTQGGGGAGGGTRDAGSNHNRDRGSSPQKAKEYRPNNVWTPAFATLFGAYSAKDREKLKLGAICRECRKSVEWVTKRLKLARGVCATSVVLGQCPPTCRFSTHDVNVDDADAAELAIVLAPAVHSLAQAAGLQRS